MWFVAGLAALAAAALLALASQPAHALFLTTGVAYLALAVGLGLLPAFVHRDWPTPMHAIAAVSLGALGLALFWNARVSTALVGASLVLGALQPLALLLSPRWETRPTPTPTDRAADFSIALGLVGALAGGILLIALPRGLPNAAHVALLLGSALPIAYGALLFLLPRQASPPVSLATLGFAAPIALALAAAALVAAFTLPFDADFRTPVAGVALAYALAIVALLRAPRVERAFLAAAFALAILAALALLLAMLYGVPNALLPVAFYAHVALALVVLAPALVLGAPLLLPGRARAGARWPKWAAALLTAALFLYTPALQYNRAVFPAAVVGAVGLAVLARGLWPLASSAPRRMRRR